MQSDVTTTAPEAVPSTPKNKGGRPKGAKTRPKWLREKMKRPRGRPKGSKNKPKTFGEFLSQAMAAKLPPSPPPRKPKDLEKVARVKRHNDSLTPEQRSANALKGGLAKRNKSGRGNLPPGWTLKDYLPLHEEAKQDARRIMKIMEKQGLLPDDEMARAAIEQVFVMMRDPKGGDNKFKHSLARTILEYTKSKPSAKSDVTIRTPEDFLDDLAKLTES